VRHLSAQPINQPDAVNNLRFVFDVVGGAGYFSALYAIMDMGFLSIRGLRIAQEMRPHMAPN